MKRALLLILLSARPALAAFEERPFSARAAGLGEAAAALDGEASAAYYNPALLRLAERASVTAGYVQILGLPELAQNSLGANLPTERQGAWGMFASDFGSALYREREAGLACAFGLGIGSAGIGVRAQSVAVRRYAPSTDYRIDLGFVGKPAPQVGAAVVARNLGETWSGARSAGAPPSLAAGIALYFWGDGPALAEIAQEESGRASWRVGQELWFLKVLALRAGFQSRPNRLSLGLGFRRPPLAIDYAVLTHADFSEQHQLNLTYLWPAVH